MRAAFLTAALLGAATAAWTFHLAFDPAPFSSSSALVMGFGLVVYAVIAIAALLLGRTRWSRWLGLAVLAGGSVVGVVTGFGAFAIVALLFTGLAALALMGPWLDLWLRRTTSLDGPGPRPTVLVLGTLALVPAVGVASPNGLEPAHGLLAVSGLLCSWGYARAWAWALWGIRVVIPALAILAAAFSPIPGAVLLIVVGAALTGLAWTPQAREAISGSRRPARRGAEGPQAARGE